MRVTYSYNGFGRVNAIGGDHSVVNSIDYNEFGQMGRVSYANGLDMEYIYDIKGRVKELVYYKENIRQVRSSYVYDTKNNIRSVSTQPEGGGFMNYASNYSYGYDGLSRLVDAQATAFSYNDGAFESKEFKRGYSYALNGNLTEKSFYNRSTGSLQDRWSYTYHNHSVIGVLSSAQGSDRLSMGYDGVGNMTAKRETQAGDSYSQAMVYDSYNRIRRVVRDANLVGEYDYDDQGFRVRKRSQRKVSGLENGQTVTTERWYELEYHNKYFAIERQKNMNGDSIPDTEYSINNVYLDGVRVAALEPSGAARYFLTDQVDSVKITADSSGKVVSRTEYYPYGETWFTEGVEDIAPKYNGQELDQESDFYYFNARHYDPELARFVTVDVVVDGEDTTAGWNRYMYVHGNPIKYKDPTGHCVGPVTGVLCGTAAVRILSNPGVQRAIATGAKNVGKFLKGKGKQIKEFGKKILGKIFNSKATTDKSGTLRLRNKQGQFIKKNTTNQLKSLGTSGDQGAKKKAVGQLAEHAKNTVSNKAVEATLGDGKLKKATEFTSSIVNPPTSPSRTNAEIIGTVASEALVNDCKNCAVK